MTAEDSHGSSRAGTATPVVGSVADEAARLVELLARRGWPSTPTADASAADASAGGESATDASAADASAGGAADAPAGDASAASGGDGHACTCGGTTPAACRVCPLCQLIAFVQRVEPDTIERVADVVGFAATALHDLATAQRARREQAGEGS